MSTLLKRLRKERGLTVEQVAKEIGIKRRMYYYIESGRMPSRAVEKRLEMFFGIPAGELLAETSDRIAGTNSG